jgi:transcription elongation factor GreB
LAMTTPFVVVGTNSTVMVRYSDGEQATYILTRDDVDAAVGRISVNSPLGKALLGRSAGESVTFRAPGGDQNVTILEVALAYNTTQ